MPQGFFTQSACVLLRSLPTLEAVKSSLANFEILRDLPVAPSWALSGPALLVNYRQQVNGLVVVDLVDRPWPDAMGEGDTESEAFRGWATGQFGAFTFPGGLQRATQQCWGWEQAPAVAAEHQAFLRVRCSYVLGAGENAPLVAPDADPLDEIEHVTSICQALLTLPEALCYFNPNGEVLRSADLIERGLSFADQHEIPALDLWCNVRLFRINDEWQMMDTVGNHQLQVPELEAIFSDPHDPDQVANFLRNLTLYAYEERVMFRNGDTTDGPSNVRWQASRYKRGISDPPRDVVCFTPVDGRGLPTELPQREKLPDENPQPEAIAKPPLPPDIA
jgi:hypothetical protein